MRRDALTKAATAIADGAFAQTAAGESRGLSLSEAMAALDAHAQEAQRTRNGRELALFEEHPERVGRLVDFLIEGNYRDVAGVLAGISSRSLRGWMSKATDGEPRYQPIAAVVEIAESLAEAAAVKQVRAAGKDPKLWASAMTFLERRHPEKWGRRAEPVSGNGVTVVIGVKDSDVQIGINSATGPVGALGPLEH